MLSRGWPGSCQGYPPQFTNIGFKPGNPIDGPIIHAAMPRFYFNLYDDVIVIDDEGRELSDLSAARAAAIQAARDLMCDQVRTGRLNLGHRIEVEDEDRRPVLTLPFSAVLEIEA
jgi:hypothetical protein